MKTGRPSLYTEELVDKICHLIGDHGRTLNSICKEDWSPKKAIIFKWLKEKEGFLDKYRRAIDDRSDYWAEQTIDLADNVTTESSAEVAKAKLQSDNRKWVISKLKPKKYGDRQYVEQKDLTKLQENLVRLATILSEFIPSERKQEAVEASQRFFKELVG